MRPEERPTRWSIRGYVPQIAVLLILSKKPLFAPTVSAWPPTFLLPFSRKKRAICYSYVCLPPMRLPAVSDHLAVDDDHGRTGHELMIIFIIIKNAQLSRWVDVSCPTPSGLSHFRPHHKNEPMCTFRLQRKPGKPCSRDRDGRERGSRQALRRITGRPHIPVLH